MTENDEFVRDLQFFPVDGCMRVIPGSHLNQLRHRTSKALERNVLGRTVEQGQFLADPVDIELNAGEISVHSDMLAHDSPENRSSRRRCGLTIRYCPTCVVPHNGWNHWGSIICRGQDPERNWKHNPRPYTDPFD